MSPMSCIHLYHLHISQSKGSFKGLFYRITAALSEIHTSRLTLDMSESCMCEWSISSTRTSCTSCMSCIGLCHSWGSSKGLFHTYVMYTAMTVTCISFEMLSFTGFIHRACV